MFQLRSYLATLKSGILGHVSVISSQKLKPTLLKHLRPETITH